MSVLTQVVTSAAERVTLHIEKRWCAGLKDGSYRQRRTLHLRDQNGVTTKVTVEELGAALRVLKVTPAELGFTAVGRAPKP